MEDGAGIGSHLTGEFTDEEGGLTAVVERLSGELSRSEMRVGELEGLLAAKVAEAAWLRRDLGAALDRYNHALMDFSEALDVAEGAVAERDLAVRWLAEGQPPAT